MIFALWAEDGPKQVANERKHSLSNSHLDIARKKHTGEG